MQSKYITAPIWRFRIVARVFLEIEYYQPLDAVLYRPLSRVKYYHPEEAFTHDSLRVL